MHMMDGSVKTLVNGAQLIAACCGFYLVWWCVAFRPEKTAHPAMETILFLLAAGSGIYGLVQMLHGITGAELTRRIFAGGVVPVCAIIVYIAMVFIMSHFFHRQLTTELLLIIGWAALMLSAVNALYGTGTFATAATAVFITITVLATVISLICYIKYYALKAWPAYYDGMVPLIMAGIVMLAMAITVRH